MTWEEAVRRLHTVAGWNIVTDAFDPERARQVYPDDRKRLVSAGPEGTLDGLSFAFYRRWTFEGAIVGLRTDDWHELRESELPERLVRGWRSEGKNHGCYTLASLAQMASLKPELRLKLSRYVGKSAAASANVLPHSETLRLFYALPPGRQEKSQSTGVFLSDLDRASLQRLTRAASFLRPGSTEFGDQPIGIRYGVRTSDKAIEIRVLFRDRKESVLYAKSGADPLPDPWVSMSGG